MPEGPVTEVFRADLDVNLKVKEALADLDRVNSQIKKTIAEMQAAFDSLQFRSPFKTWQTEIEMVGRELAALTMPRAMRFDLPERELERYVGRIKEIASEFGVTTEEINAYLVKNAEAFTTYSRAGAEAFIAAMQKMSDEVWGGSIIPEMVAGIQDSLRGLLTGLADPFMAIVQWARSASDDTKLQFRGMVEGVIGSLTEMVMVTKTQTAMTAAEAERMLFGPTEGFGGLMDTVDDLKQSFRLLTAEGGNVGLALEMMSKTVGDVAVRFGGSNEAVQTFLDINSKVQPILAAVGNAILGMRDAALGHDAMISRLAKNTGQLTESLQLQARVWRSSTEVAKASQGELGTYVEVVTRRLSSALSALDTSLKHVSTSFLATGKISKERLQDASEAVRDLTVAMANAQKLGIPLHPEFEARMRKAIDAVRLFTAEEQRLVAGQKTQVERQRERIDAIGQVNEKTREMISYLRPGGDMMVGLTSTNMMLRDGSAHMQKFSLSIGSALSVLAGIGGVLGQLHPAFAAVMVGVAQMADRFVTSIAVMHDAATTGKDRILAAMSAMGAIFTGFGIAAIGAMVATGRLAADIETLWITLKTTAVNVGISIPAITEKLESLKDAGITTKESMMALTQFLRAKLPLDQLDALAEAAKNVAVTMPQMTSSEVMQRFVWVIQSGNSALLDALGIQKTVNMFVEEYADKMGIATKALTVQQKQLAIITGLINEAASFQGVYNEAMATAGKQLSSMVRYWEELRLKIGEQFLPIVTKVVFAFAELLKGLQNMKPDTLKLITLIVAVIGIFGTFLGVLLLLAPGITALTGLIGGLVGVIGSVITTTGAWLVAAVTSIPGLIAFATTVGGTIPIIGGLVAIIYKAIQGFRDIYTPLEGVEGLLYRLKVAFRPIIATWEYFRDEILAARWVRIKEGLDKIIERLRGFADENEEVVALVERAWAVAKDLIWSLMEVIDELLGAFGDLLNYDYEGMWEHFKNAAATALGWIAELFVDFVLAAYDWGVNMISQLAIGLIDAARTAIPTAAEYVGGMLQLFLEGRSPPIKGPLKRIRMWGKGVGEAFGAGIGDVNITGYMTTIGQQFSALRSKAKEWGWNLTGTFAEGISLRAVGAIAPAMEVIGNEISRFLAGASPPEAGRLAELQDWGKSAMEAFMEGFSMADFGVFDQALSMIETRLKTLIGTAKEQSEELAAAMLDMRARVAEAIAAMGPGAAVDISNLANSIFQNVAVPVMDILQVAQAQLQAEAAKDVIAAIQDEIAAARESRRKAVEAIQDVIYAFQEEIEVLNERKEALTEKIKEEVKARLEMVGLVIDPAVMKRLQAELRSASLQVKRQEAELQKYAAYRERLGIDMLSWEEVSLMASLDLARQKQSEAQIAVDEEQDRVAWAKDLADMVEAQYAAEFEAIEERIKQTQKAIKEQQKLLRQTQRADQEASRAEQERLKAAQDYAKALADHAALLKKALEERLKAEELYAKSVGEEADAVEEEVNRRELMIAGWRKAAAARMKKLMEAGKEGIPLEPSEELKSHIERLRELLAGGPRAIFAAIAQAVYDIAKPILARFGIDLDEVLAKARLKWENIKTFFAGLKERWTEALGKAEEILAPIFEAIKTHWDTLKKVVTDPELKKAWEGLKDAFGELWEVLKPLLIAIKDLVIQSGAWKAILIVLIPLYVLLRVGIAILTGIITAMTRALEGAIGIIKGMITALTGTVEVITGILTLDPTKIGEGFKKIFEGNVQVIKGFITTAYEVMGGFITGALEALGLGGIVDAFVELKDRVVEKVKAFVNDVINWFTDLYNKLIAKSIIWDIVNGIIGAFQGLVDKAIAWGLQLIKNLVTGIVSAWILLTAKIWEITNKIGEIGLYILLNVWTWGKNLISEIVRGITETWFVIDFKILEIKNKIGEISTYIIMYAMNWGSNLISLIVQGIVARWEAFSVKVLEIKSKIGEIGAYVLEKALGWGSDLLNKFRMGIILAWIAFAVKIGEVLNKIYEINIGDRALEWGRNLINKFAEGIRDRFFGNLMPLLIFIADFILSRFGFLSAPKEGPLKGAEAWGPNMMQMLAGGIRANSGLVFDEIAALASGLSAGLNVGITPPGMGLTPVTVSYAPVLNFYGPTSPEEVKQAVVEAPSEIDWKGMIRR